jgi:hypothetical protein
MRTETEYSVWMYIDSVDRLSHKGTHRTVGEALAGATYIAEQQPGQIVIILQQEVLRLPWESPDL